MCLDVLHIMSEKSPSAALTFFVCESIVLLEQGEHLFLGLPKLMALGLGVQGWTVHGNLDRSIVAVPTCTKSVDMHLFRVCLVT